MLIAVWRVSGRGFTPAEFVTRFGLTASAVFPARRKTSRSSSRNPGCNIAVPGEGSQEAVLRGLKLFLRRNRRAFLWLKRNRIHNEVDIAVGVGGDPQYTQSMSFDPRLLLALAVVGTTLRVSGYPVSIRANKHFETDAQKDARGSSARRSAY